MSTDQDYFDRHANRAELAREAASQLTYILSTLGIMDVYGAANSLRITLKQGREGDLRSIIEALRTVKIQVWATIEDSKAQGRKVAQAETDKAAITTDASFWQARAEAREGN